ncbi:MAG: FAD-dependent oxidoreductase, partial [Oscillospiraceae bacterium]
MKYDIAIIGGSLGGVRAAIKACESGKKVYMCEETDWIGGQLTSQGVPPDEHKWIEEFGATKSYLDYRKKVRNYYQSLPEASDLMKSKEHFCPGNSWVTRVAHEPKVALKIFNDELKPFLKNGSLTLEYFTVAVDADVQNQMIFSVEVKNISTEKSKVIEAKYFLDATDCGDLLPIVKAEYRTGAEAKSETNELHAPDVANPFDMQPTTVVAALELNPDGDYKIEKPEMYDYFSELGVPYSDNKLFSWYCPDAETKGKELFSFYDNELPENPLGLWSYRRIIDTKNYTDGRKEVSLMNIPQNDFSLGNIYEDAASAVNRHLAREQTLSMVYWLQNDAPRKDGGKGYPVKLRTDIFDTDDGLAKAPYIRESRRIVAKKIICEQDVSRAANEKPKVFEDSVGVGHYAVDIHLTTKTHTFFY